jgi:hypothetical protein
MPGTGRCGRATKGGCIEMVPQAYATPGPAPATPTPVEFVIHNQGPTDLFLVLQAGTKDAPFFRLERPGAAGSSVLSVPENHWCPCACPQEGMAKCVDCGRPPDRALPLEPGQRHTLHWDGNEHPWTTRWCPDGEPGTCVVTWPTRPGPLQVEICASVGAPQVDAQSDHSVCGRSAFSHPPVGPVHLRLGAVER